MRLHATKCHRRPEVSSVERARDPCSAQQKQQVIKFNKSNNPISLPRPFPNEVCGGRKEMHGRLKTSHTRPRFHPRSQILEGTIVREAVNHSCILLHQSFRGPPHPNTPSRPGARVIYQNPKLLTRSQLHPFFGSIAPSRAGESTAATHMHYTDLKLIYVYFPVALISNYVINSSRRSSARQDRAPGVCFRCNCIFD